MQVRWLALMALVALVASASEAGAQQRRIILKHEPPPGSIRAGRSVLVDDGSCPAGQLKLVTFGRQPDGSRRKRTCVERR
jgi:hypothetical protein